MKDIIVSKKAGKEEMVIEDILNITAIIEVA